MPHTRDSILIIEDNAVNRKIIHRILAEQYALEEAENGRVALDLLQSGHRYSGILLDLVMPVMDGYTFLEEAVRLGFKGLPVVVMTGESDPAAEKRVFDLGAWDFVTKPIQPQTLRSRLQNALARSEVTLLRQLQYVSEHDTLTGLYNRETFLRETRRLVDANPDTLFAFVRFDIDRFRLFSASMGEAEGNRLLCYVAERLRSVQDKMPLSIFGHVESDVFGICIPYDRALLERAFRIAKENIRTYRKDYVLECCFGVYLIEQRDVNVETILARATLAAEKNRHEYLAAATFFDATMEQHAEQEQKVINEMQTALNEQQFVVYLQPKYDLKTEAPCGAEALVRWKHPRDGMISPGVFIPVFEKNGFIASLDYYMWEHVCILLKKWLDEGHAPMPVSVNMSRISLYNPSVPELLHELVEKYRVPPRLLELEITESAYMSNPTLMKSTLSRLKQYGFVLLMDDFGSGYSSLNTLKAINVDVLKIDMSFLPSTTGPSDGKSEKILSSVVRMAGWLGMPVIAEGVETIEQKQFLFSIGCDYVQGYYYARPMPVDSYEALVETANRTAGAARPALELHAAEAIWSADGKVEEILHSISLPVAIYECSPAGAQVVRVNSAYNEEFGYPAPGSIAAGQISNSDRQALRLAFNQIMADHADGTCEFASLSEAGRTRWYRLKLHYLESVPSADLLCGIYMDISAEKEYESHLGRVWEMLNSSTLPRRQMLVVDDEEASRSILSNLFHEQYDVLEASNGVNALELMKQHRDTLAVILLDMIMPEMGGEAFLRAKNADASTAEIPVVVISADSSTHVQRNMLEMGVNDYITKPFVPEVTVRRVMNVVDYGSRFAGLRKEYRALIEGGKKN